MLWGWIIFGAATVAAAVGWWLIFRAAQKDPNDSDRGDDWMRDKG